ncbi:MAG: glycerol kinase [Deltaproteobacteria bacterium CG11_big_fil_rev_8_21_14_0_20_45_16]|nr:MAG: glycerol kinase [Deltaproteobacteria bacterium CG11_big_fil_rev_8_21_14_0_20_45_16]
MSFILGIDQGTTGSTACLLNEQAKVIATSTSPVPQHFPRPGWVEHRPEEIWQSLTTAVSTTLNKAKISTREITSIGLTNQRETLSLFQGSNALHPFIVWQDRRTSDACKKLKSKGKIIRSRSGTPVDPYFSSTKIAWLIKHLKISKRSKDIKFRTIDSFVLNRMTGANVTEATNAHRTQLVNLKSARWDSVLLDIFDIPHTFCPEIIASEGMNLKTKGLDFLPDGIPIQACLGDQQAALFGQLAWKKGEGKITYGTGAFVLLNTGDRPVHSKNSLVSTLAWEFSNGKKTYALEGSAFICGAWVQWLRDQLGLIRSSEEIESLAREVTDSGGVMIVPALTGLGAPFWRSELRASIQGLTRGSSKAHIARASLEALCFQNRALIDAMKRDASLKKTRWKVDGGAVKNNLLLEIQADVLNCKIYRPKNLEATAIGVALLAGYASGLYDLHEIAASYEPESTFEARPQQHHALSKTFSSWMTLVKNSPLTN